MFKFILSLSALIVLLSGCKATSIIQESQTNTTQQLSIGSIGLDKDFILQSGFNNAAIPNYKKPIKVSVSKIAFNKATHKAFVKAKTLQTANVSVNYIDSIANKPKFIRLQIADKVSLINALNNENNSDIKTYLKNNASANIITNISLALNNEDLNAITKADGVFLIEKSAKTYALQLYEEGIKTTLIWFNKSIVFEYKVSSCCWQEDKQKGLNIVDIVSQYNSCPNKTYRSANKAKKKTTHYKF